MRLTHITTTAIVFALGIATASAAAAGDSGTAPAVLPNPDQQPVTEQPQPAPPHPTANRTAQANPNHQSAVTSAPAVIVRTTAPSNGFDWGDAGIGAAGAPRTLGPRPRRGARDHSAPHPPRAPINTSDELSSPPSHLKETHDENHRVSTTAANRAHVFGRERGEAVVVRRLKVLAAAGAMVLLAMLETGGLAKAAHPRTNGRISFSALPCCAGPISTMNADGGDVQPLSEPSRR